MHTPVKKVNSACHPQDIRLFGQHLTLLSLKHLTLEPRGHPYDINAGVPVHLY